MFKSLWWVCLWPSILLGSGSLWQFGTLSSLVAGGYEGCYGVGQIQTGPDLYGLGTFADLDGEMVICQGRIYQVKSDGVVYPVAGGRQTPFACAARLDQVDRDLKDQACADKAQMQDWLAGQLPSLNYPALIVAEGTFASVTTRSVPAQHKPYPTLAEVVKSGQVVFDLGPQQGTLIGFYFPAAFAGLNAAGWHFHFINTACSAGGHSLDFSDFSGRVRVESLSDMEIRLPDLGSDFARMQLGSLAAPKVQGE